MVFPLTLLTATATRTYARTHRTAPYACSHTSTHRGSTWFIVGGSFHVHLGSLRVCVLTRLGCTADARSQAHGPSMVIRKRGAEMPLLMVWLTICFGEVRQGASTEIMYPVTVSGGTLAPGANLSDVTFTASFSGNFSTFSTNYTTVIGTFHTAPGGSARCTPYHLISGDVPVVVLAEGKTPPLPSLRWENGCGGAIWRRGTDGVSRKAPRLTD